MAAATFAPAWFTARAAGLGALVAASLALSAGLTLALRPAFLRGRTAELRAVHEALALCAFGLVAVHGLALALDPVLHAGLAAVLVPFAMPFKPLSTGLGQLAAYGMAGLGLTFYVRRRLGTIRWRNAHRWVPVPWALAVGHGLLTGTDAGRVWALAAAAPPVLLGLVLLAQRHLAEPAGLADPAG